MRKLSDDQDWAQFGRVKVGGPAGAVAVEEYGE